MTPTCSRGLGHKVISNCHILLHASLDALHVILLTWHALRLFLLLLSLARYCLWNRDPLHCFFFFQLLASLNVKNTRVISPVCRTCLLLCDGHPGMKQRNLLRRYDAQSLVLFQCISDCDDDGSESSIILPK